MFKDFILSFVKSFSASKVTVTSILAAIGGIITSLVGGWDTLLMTYITLMVIDYVTGVIRAVYQKKLSSAIGYKGIIKKVLSICIVVLAVVLQRLIPAELPLREITLLFFIANEGISILENAAGVIPLPSKLKEVLIQLRNGTGDKSKSAASGETPKTEEAAADNEAKAEDNEIDKEDSAFGEDTEV
ncbi:MAG: holin family protein [Ruminococcus sp.]